MSEGPLCSIIVPNYNHSDYLEERLQSIFAQTIQNFEVILLDDASTDNSLEILKKYASRPEVSQLITNKKNSGSPFKQWDKGIALAQGEFIWIAETDDYCENDFLEKLIPIFSKQPDISLAFCQSYRVNDKGEVTGNWLSHTDNFKFNPFQDNFIMNGNLFIQDYLIHKNVIPNVSAVVFKKNFLKRIQPLTFEPYMKYNADWLYYIQVTTNKRVAFISESLNYFRYNETSVTGKAPTKSGWLQIFQMELLTRKRILQFIEGREVDNLKLIKREHKKGTAYLFYLISKIYFIRGEYIKWFSLIFPRPSIYKRVINDMIQKIFPRIS